MRLVDDDYVPIALVRPNAELRILLQRVDRDDRLVVVVERVGVGRDVAADAVQSNRVEPNKRDREPRPQLLWNWVIMPFVVTTKMRLPLPRLINSLRRMPTSIVLPKPTASAIRMRCLGCCSARSAGSN